MLTVFVSDVVVTAVILNTTFIRALTSLARANTAVFTLLKNISVTQSLSVSWLVFWKFNGDSNLFPDRSDQKIDCRYCGGRYLF